MPKRSDDIVDTRNRAKTGKAVWKTGARSRPSFPDSLPCLGAIPGVNNIIAAFGHSHYGLGMAPATSEIIADCITKNIDHETLLPYSIMRFQ